MKKETLSQTNPYLRDKAQRKNGLLASVSSSSAIDGITTASSAIKAYLNSKNNIPTPHKPPHGKREQRLGR